MLEKRTFLDRLTQLLPPLVQGIAVRFDLGRITTVERLTRFIATRSSYISQTALFGYLKTRMGTRFPSMFEDEVFAKAIARSRTVFFTSCLADLTIFTVATIADDNRLNARETAILAEQCFENAINQSLDSENKEIIAPNTIERFKARVAQIDWTRALEPEKTFSGSHRDLIRMAPVIDEFKELDEEIVTNSIRFRWRDVREQFKKKIDSAAVSSDWKVTCQNFFTDRLETDPNQFAEERD